MASDKKVLGMGTEQFIIHSFYCHIGPLISDPKKNTSHFDGVNKLDYLKEINRNFLDACEKLNIHPGRVVGNMPIFERERWGKLMSGELLFKDL